MTDDDRLRGYLKRAIADARDAKHRLREIQDRAHEPIAIVGIGCRFPGGVQTPEDLWRMVSTGGEGVSGFPTDRGWQLDGFFHPDPDHPGTSYVSEGAFLSGIGEFDPGFFGISPREAMATDPQQRLLLETSWECLERAGIRPDTLRGSDTGVFAGISALDYGIVLAKTESGRAGTLPMSTASSMVSGRISYTLGLEGPAITVDTACSSSLVSLHLAVRALRSNECSLALAGGVTVMSVPDPFVTFSRQRGLARDGRCKAFAAGADGFSLAEGVGVLAVQRLSDARREGRPVLAVISGTAVNQDGASSAFSAPNGPSQERVIRTALADAGLSTSDIDAVEAHGTGTSLGDPIEATALQAVYGKERLPGRPLWLGSVKSNIAHTQGAAGVAGVVKMVMAIHNGLLPKTLHVDEPSPHVDWDPDGVRLLTEAIDWPDTGRPRRAGVSSFGISGTNAHVILEQPAPPQESDGDTAATAVAVATETSEPAVFTAGSPASWPLSAATEPALREQARRLLSHLETDLDSSITDIGFSLATTRTAFEWRAALVGGDRAEFVRELAGLATDNPDVPVVRGRAAGRGRTVFVFPGQGSQWSGMALELLESSPVFARRFGECARALGAFVDWSPVEVLREEESAPSLERVDVVQPVLFAVVVSLAELWRSVGVVPSAVVGHSQGEIAAACVAGVLSLEDAARVVALRSRLIGEVLAGHGGMASVGLSDARVRELIGRWGGALSVAAVNGPGSTVVSGDADAVAELVTACDADGVQAKTIAVDYASHSAQVERIRAELVEVLDGIRPHAADVPLLSTVTGGWIDGARLDAEYWYRNLRGTVEFEGAIGALAEQGYTTFIECSPHPVLTTSIEDTLTETNVDGLVTGTLRRDDGGPRRFLRSLGELDVHGVPVDRTRLFPGATRVELPTYAFQHQWYWPRPAPEDGDVHSAGLISAGHPLLAATVAMPASGGLALTGKLSVSTHPWLADHAVLDTVILPGTGFVELALRAGEEVGCARLEELTIAAPLVIPQDGGVDLHVAISPEDPRDTDRHAVTIHSRPAGLGDAPWTTHAEGVLSQSEPEPSITLDQWPPADAAALDVAEIYGRLAAAGIDYGPTFHGLTAAWQCGDEVLAEIRLPDGAEPAADRFGIHPAVLDAALHPVGPVLDRAAKDGPDGGGDGARLPFSWRGVQLHAAGAAALRVRVTPAGPDELSVVVADESGKPVASVESLVLRPVAAGQLGVDRDVVRDSLFTVEWPTLTEHGEPPVVHATAPAIQVFADRGALTAALDSGAEIPGTVAVRVPDECAEPADDPLRVGLTGTLALLRRWLEEERLADTRLVVVTGGAVAVHPGEDVAPDHAAVWGLVRSAQSEHPGRFVLLDLDDDESVDFALARADANEQLAIRRGTAHVPRLVRAALPDDAPPLTFDPEGTVLITGGVGTLGGLVARHLATEHGVRHLMLASRRGGAAEGAVDLVNELCGLGTDVTLASCDVADRDAVAQLLREIPDEHPLTAVVHTAGAIDDGVVGSLTDEQLDRVLRPKADGARNLHELTRDLDLSAFVVFSSAATTFGAAGQANYAAANAFLDALAQHRHALGLPAVSLAWGLWAERSGLTGDLSDSDLARMASGGVSAMPTADALALFDAGLTAGTPVLVPTPLDIRALRHRADSGTLPALLHALVPPRPRRVAGEASGNDVSGFLGRLAAMSDDDRSRALLDLVRSQAASVLGHDSVAEVEPERAFKELGFDSLTGVELRNRLAAVIGTRLPATLVFDHPTPLAIAGLLHDKLGGGQGSGIETVLAEIDSLDTRLADFEDGDRSRVTARLRALLAKTDVPGAAGEAAQDLSSASDDEMFAFIDKQLGA